MVGDIKTLFWTVGSWKIHIELTRNRIYVYSSSRLMCWFVARKSFCQLEREFIMGISTSNHKIKKQDEAIDNKRLVSLGFQMCQCCFPPPLLLLWSRGKGPGARLLPAAAHRVKITSNEPRHK